MSNNLDLNQIYNENCLDTLGRLEDNSIDSVVSDPPYGLSNAKPEQINTLIKEWASGNDEFNIDGKGFMGKQWDAFVPSPAIFKEVYRVMKPGAYAVFFCGTRTQDLMTLSLRLSGFEVRDVIEWLYFSGFPKNHDISKAIDKKDAKVARRERDLKFTAFMRSTGLTAKEINEATETKMGSHYLTDKEQPAVAVRDLFEKIRPLISIEVPSYIEEMINERTIESENFKKREVIGESDKGSSTGSIVTTGTGNLKKDFDITSSFTPEAKQWEGWGTALKPSHEPIILVRKPFKGSVADNVLTHGTGGLNIDECRIGNEEISTHNAPKGTFAGGEWDRGSEKIYKSHEGRFPANSITLEEDQFYSKFFNITPPELSKKASKKDRNSNYQGEQLEIKNNHPTVKAIPLMEWLIKLITPVNGVVYDPFSGSGSTLVAAKRLQKMDEKYKDLRYIGSELEEEYAEIIKKRLED